MTVLAIVKQAVELVRVADFMAKLAVAMAPRFNSPVMPRTANLLRSRAPGPDTCPLFLVIEYPDMAAYSAGNAFESANWNGRRLSRRGRIRRRRGSRSRLSPVRGTP
jgi:hypothetical protein